MKLKAFKTIPIVDWKRQQTPHPSRPRVPDSKNIDLVC